MTLDKFSHRRFMYGIDGYARTPESGVVALSFSINSFNALEIAISRSRDSSSFIETIIWR